MKQKKQKKESDETCVSASDSPQTISIDNDNIDNADLSIEETQKYRKDGNYERCYTKEEKKKSRHWTFIVYKDSAPVDWIQQLEQTGLAFVVSPYHDKDVNYDKTPKKPHYHVIVSYSNTTTYNNVCSLREITKGPFPLAISSVGGLYAYLTHKHNPEKYQYDETNIKRYNGWNKALETTEISVIKTELTNLIYTESITEYNVLIATAITKGDDYAEVAMKNTVYFNALCKSMRYNSAAGIKRYYELTDNEDIKAKLKIVLDKLRNEI